MSNNWLENENFTRTTAIVTLFRCGNLSIILLQISVTYQKKRFVSECSHRTRHFSNALVLVLDLKFNSLGVTSMTKLKQTDHFQIFRTLNPCTEIQDAAKNSFSSTTKSTSCGRFLQSLSSGLHNGQNCFNCRVYYTLKYITTLRTDS